MKDLYIRSAAVKRIIDGDTLVVIVDLGFSIATEQTVRLAGINAPEVVGEDKAAGLAAKLWLIERLPVGTLVRVHTVKDNDKYGRYLANVLVPGEAMTINEQLVAAGHAVAIA